MRRYGHLPGRKCSAARAIIGGAALVASLFVAAGPVQAVGLSAGPVQAVGLSAVPVPAHTALAAPAAVPAPAVVLAPAMPAPPAAIGVPAIGVPAIAVQPGTQYVISDKELCTTGFAVISATGQAGFATAGHCGAPGDTVQTPHGEALGTLAASAFPGTDYGWVTTNSQYATVAAVTMPTGAVAAVRGAVPAAVGAPVCVLGQASGWHCGIITATDQTVQYDQGAVSGLTATSVCSDAGDSGGVLISGDQAQGVVSGGIGDCSDNGTTYFQPLAPILTAYGLTLRIG